MTALAPTLQSFFTDYLIGQRGASTHTIGAYRDSFRLLLNHLHHAPASSPTASTSATSTPKRSPTS